MDPLHIFLGDTHSGSSVSVQLPIFYDNDQRPQTASPVQALIYEWWQRALVAVQGYAVGHRVALHLGGDLVDGVHHHGSLQTWGSDEDQADHAAALLRPWLNLADTAYAVHGTKVHGSPTGYSDRAVATRLGVPIRHRWLLDCGGHLLDHAHHANLGTRPWTEENALLTRLKSYLYEARKRDEVIPDLIVRHHVHRYVQTGAEGVTIVTVPGWQAQTDYTRQRWPEALLTLGLLLWWPCEHRLHPLTFDFPGDPVEAVDYEHFATYPRPDPRPAGPGGTTGVGPAD